MTEKITDIPNLLKASVEEIQKEIVELTSKLKRNINLVREEIRIREQERQTIKLVQIKREDLVDQTEFHCSKAKKIQLTLKRANEYSRDKIYLKELQDTYDAEMAIVAKLEEEFSSLCTRIIQLYLNIQKYDQTELDIVEKIDMLEATVDFIPDYIEYANFHRIPIRYCVWNLIRQCNIHRQKDLQRSLQLKYHRCEWITEKDKCTERQQLQWKWVTTSFDEASERVDVFNIRSKEAFGIFISMGKRNAIIDL
jgi:hypothetical protein